MSTVMDRDETNSTSVPALGSVPVRDAVVFLPDALWPTARRRVAGLPLLERALRILHRTGIDRVTLVTGRSAGELSPGNRGQGPQIEVAPEWTGVGRPVVAFTADLAFEPGLLSKLLKRRSGGIDGWRLSGEAQPGIVLGPLEGTFSRFEDVLRVCSRQEATGTGMDVEWTCHRIRTAADAHQFHLKLERHLMKSVDGMFARWNRRVSLPLTRVLAHLPVTPNMITYFTLLVSGWGAYWLASGGYWEMLIGALLTQAASILDGNDGELARLRISDSDYGTWLDTLCDYVSYFLTFGSIVLGLYRQSGSAAYLWLGALIFAGFGLSMMALSYFRRYRVPRGQAGQLSNFAIRKLESNADDDWVSLWSKRLRHFATRAVFSYFLILFGVLNLWGLVLVLAAIGSHLVWIGCLYHSKHMRVPEQEAQLGNQ